MSTIQSDLDRVQESIEQNPNEFRSEFLEQLNRPQPNFDKALRDRIGQIHDAGMRIAQAHKRCEYEMVSILSKLHVSSGYALFGVESLKQYAIQLWDVSNSTASDLVTVANKAVEIPEMIEALRLRKATVSKLRKVCPVITPQNHKPWLGLVAECSTRIIERCVSLERGEEEEVESIKYKPGQTVQIIVDVPEELWRELKYARDLLAQKRQGHVKLSQAMQYLTELGLNTLDPIRKARAAQERLNKREANAKKKEEQASQSQNQSSSENTSIQNGGEEAVQEFNCLHGTNHSSDSDAEQSSELYLAQSPEEAAEQCPEQCADQHPEQNEAIDWQQPLSTKGSSSKKQAEPVVTGPAREAVATGQLENAKSNSNRRKKLKAATIHAINLRDNHQCTATRLDGTRCENRRYLHVHHVIPVSHGGTDEISNLQTVCSAHHRAHHLLDDVTARLH